MINVLDASALLIVLHGEPGADQVEPLLEGSVISAVNWSEVIQKAISGEVDVTHLREEVEALGVRVKPFDASAGEAVASLWQSTRSAGLSLGDRACLALAIDMNATAVTADKAWSDVKVGVAVRVVR